MLVPTPMQVAGEVASVRSGRLLSISNLRERLAAKSGADFTCPLCTGIFLNIIAGAAEEDLSVGRKPVAPYWRIVRDDGSLSEKLPPGMAQQARRLRAEGHKIRRAGRKWRVEGFGEASKRPPGAKRRL